MSPESEDKIKTKVVRSTVKVQQSPESDSLRFFFTWFK